MSTQTLASTSVTVAQARSAPSFGQWAALIGAALFAAIPILWWPAHDLLFSAIAYVDPPTPDMMRIHALRHFLEAPGPALLAVGLIALYRRHRRDLGAIGQAGLALLVFGLALRAALASGIVITEGMLSFQFAPFEFVHPSPVIAMLGSLAFGFGALRARMLPRVGVLLVLLSAVAIFVELGTVGLAEGTGWLIAEALMGANALGFVAIGYRFWRED